MSCVYSKVRSEAKAKGTNVVPGHDMVLGPVPGAFRYQDQAQRTRPRYWNPWTGSEDSRIEDVTFESNPGRVWGLPRLGPETGSGSPARVKRQVPSRPSVIDVDWAQDRRDPPDSRRRFKVDSGLDG